MRRGRGSALVFVLIMMVAMATAIISLVAFAGHVYNVESRSEESAVATMALDGATSDIRSELDAGTISGPGTVNIAVGTLTVNSVITDNSATIANTYLLSNSVTVAGQSFKKSYVIGYNTGQGLFGQFFDDTNEYFGSLIFQRTDLTVNYNWSVTSPASPVPLTDYAARWTGTITPTSSGNYTFTTVSDDGVRLWVNGNLLINDWADHATTTDTSASISLTSGKSYQIRFDYYQHGGQAIVALKWTPPFGSLQVIPSSVLQPAPLAQINADEVDLSSSFNQDGMAPAGDKADGNLGSSSRTLPTELLPSKLNYNGVHFDIGSGAVDNALNVVRAAGQTISLPNNHYTSVRVLVASTSATTVNDSFTLKYTDFSTASSSPSLYDWRGTLATNEDVALTIPYVYSSTTTDWNLTHLQVVTLPANATKYLSSIQLPNRSTTVILAITCVY